MTSKRPTNRSFLPSSHKSSVRYFGNRFGFYQQVSNIYGTMRTGRVIRGAHSDRLSNTLATTVRLLTARESKGHLSFVTAVAASLIARSGICAVYQEGVEGTYHPILSEIMLRVLPLFGDWVVEEVQWVLFW